MKTYKVICPLISLSIPNMLIGQSKLSPEETMEFFKKQEEKLTRGISLVDGLKIRRISKDDLDDLSTPILSSLSSIQKFSPNSFVLEKRVKGKRDFNTHQTMQNVVLALRLLKGGYVSGNYTFYILLSEKGRNLTSWAMEEAPRLFGGYRASGYVLNIEEIPSLRKLVKRIQAIDFTKRYNLYVALKRFQRAYEETDDEDRLIDFVIAFEALFLKGEKAGHSLGRTIAVACSVLLGENEQKREEIKRALAEAYKIRNRIVHGSEYERIKKDSKEDQYFDTLPDLVSEVEDYLRKSIKKFLN